MTANDKALALFDQKDRRLQQQFVAARHTSAPQLNFARELEYAAAIIKGSDELQRCSAESVRTALLDAAHVGLSLSAATAHAYLIPYGSTCTFKPGYRGYIHLVMRAGTVKLVQGNLVHQGDDFRVWTDDSGRHLNHEEKFVGAVTHAYALARFSTGEVHITVMTKDQLDAVEKVATSRSRGGMVWRGPFKDQMQIKAVIRRGVKFWPLDNEGYMAYAMAVMDKYDPVEFDTEEPSPESPGGDLLINEEQAQSLHALLIEHKLTEDRANEWLRRKAEAMGYKSIREVPAKLFEEVKAALTKRAGEYREALTKEQK
jgi:phage RecT family recombinase